MLIDDGAVARFGAALAWADRRGAASLDVLVDGPDPLAAGVIARRAACFCPAPAVWSVSGRSITPAAPSPVAEYSVADDPPASEQAVIEMLKAEGLEVVSEHGVLRGEVLGLEVARTVGGRLEVGVGRHDRLARAEMRPGEPVVAALAEAAAAVRSRRRLGAPPHPANTLARSRWLRSVLTGSPSMIGLSELEPVPPPLPWFDLPEAGAAPAVGTTSTGRLVLVVCSVGVDLDLVPTAGDCRLFHGSTDPVPPLWLVVPDGDDLPVTSSLASRLSPAAEVRTVPRGWEGSAV